MGLLLTLKMSKDCKGKGSLKAEKHGGSFSNSGIWCTNRLTTDEFGPIQVDSVRLLIVSR